MSNTIRAASTTPASAPVTSSEPKAKRPRPKLANPAVLADSTPDAAIPTLPPAAPSPPIALTPPSAPSPTQSLAQGATTTTGVHIPPADLASLSPADLASHIAKIRLLAASLGDAQRAAMPPELLQSLAVFAALTPGSAPAQPPTPKSGIDDALFGGDSDLSGPESASESNPPIANQGPASSSTQSQAQSGSKAKTAAKAKVVLPGADNGEAESVGAKTARVIRAAKGGKGTMAVDWSGGEPVTASTKNTGTRGKGKTVAVTADNEDEVVTIKQPTRKSTRNATNTKQGVIAGALSPYDLPASEWNTLNATVGGRLARGVPLARACFGQAGTNVTEAAPGLDCATVQSNYANFSWRAGIYPAGMWLQWETCQKTNQGCLLDPRNPQNASAFSSPRITVKTAADVTQGFAFSNRTGVPLSIKNTGHDLAGRSVAPGTLAFWTNNIKYINYSATFIPEGCNQDGVPALTYGAGQDTGSLYEFAELNNITFIGGSARTIGAAGGWLQGGGHSILTNTHGLGVDRVLQFRLVTPDGRARVANACQNQDLFWALRGGGGGTFGVVLEATSQVIPSPVSTIALSWQLTPTPDIIKSFFSILVQNSLRWAQEGWGGYFYPTASILANPRMNASQAAESLKPLTDFLANTTSGSVGNGTQPQWTQHPSYLSLLSTTLASADALVPSKFASSSRLIPQSSFSPSNSSALIAAMLQSWSTADNVAYFMTTPYSYRVPNSEQGKTSVTPAWRGAVWHALAFTGWDWDAGADEAAKAYVKANTAMNPLRNITPGSGAYQNEADVYEPGASASFWGDNYPALYAIKQKYDPDGLLDCWHCVLTR
ncbi:hypothetical protein FRC11_004850 [Ceratobasidium sp. 423]|nr:hypothetical protein FRC11_004850 [Ceratobasidium sp. 423]